MIGQFAEIITGTPHAPRLLQRHERLNRSREIADAVLQLRDGDRTALARVREVLARQGSFLKRYDLSVIESRLASDRWVIAEAAGYSDGRLVAAGDCHCLLPEDKGDAPPIVELPNRDGDQVYCDGLAVVSQIRGCGACAASVVDLSCDDVALGRGLATAAKVRAFGQIAKLNLAREFPVRYLIGEVFSIRGLSLPDGSRVLLDDFGERPLENEASLRTNALRVDSRRQQRPYPGVRGWKLRERNVGVALAKGGHAAEYGLLTDWIAIIVDLATPGAGNVP
jgi:hypothetical protein